MRLRKTLNFMKLILNLITIAFPTFVKQKLLTLFKLSLIGLLFVTHATLASGSSHALNSDEDSKHGEPNYTNDILVSPSFVNSRYESLKKVIFDQPYSQLPQYKVKKRLFGSEKKVDENKLLEAAKRTFESTDDLIELPTNQKLLNANGICFSGTWNITQENEYSGLYKKGTHVAAIIRASVALSGTTQKNKRGFGMAMKLLPSDLGDRPSLNAFVLHSMGGTITKHVLDLELDNEPPLGRLPKFSDLSTALRLRRDLEKADKEKGAKKPTVSYRPVNQFAEYKIEKEQSLAPKWLKLSPITTTRLDENDFRDEFNVSSYPDQKIRYAIEVAQNSDNGKKSKAQWQTIGELSLTDSVTSLACDTQLHFQHPVLGQN